MLALAAKQAKALNHTYIGTEHILLGLLREADGQTIYINRFSVIKFCEHGSTPRPEPED